MSLDELLALWRARQEAQGLAERTIAERAALVRRFAAFAGEDPLHFSAARTTLFLGRPGLRPRTRWVYRQHLSAFAEFLVAVHLREDSPLVDVPTVRKPAGEPRPVEQHELEAVLARVTGTPRAMVLLAAFAGLRVHEVAKFRGADLDRKAGTLRVEGKGGKEARLPVHPAILAEAVHYPERDFWFPSPEGGPVTRQHVSRTIRQALAAAGVDATAHQLRHWHATALLAAGVDIRVVQELMRHSSLQSTQGYTRVSQAQRSEAIGRLEVPGQAGA